MNTLKNHEPSKGELMQVRRLITLAGRLQDEIEPKVKELNKLKDEIKKFEAQMAVDPGTPVVLVSGEYVAELSAERRGRDFTPEVNSKVFHRVGVQKFMSLVKLIVPAVTRELGEEVLDVIAPLEYQGTGRSFKLVKKA